jgi:hypothetical protein
MKYLPAILFLVLLSCKEITYTEPQPKGKKTLAEIPNSLRGKYLLIDDNGVDKDTLYIDKNGYHIRGGDNDEGILGDSLVLKKYKGYYFLNINQRPEWVLRVIKQEKNGDIVVMAMDDKNFNSFLKKLGNEIRIDSTQKKDEQLYQIDPTPKQLVGLVKKKYFGQTTRIKKIQ